MIQDRLDPDALDWTKGDGLLPVVVQDAASLRVLMLGYMDRAALEQTRRSGHVTFYSRSKRRLWTKGETSGHVLELVSVDVDCDADTLLVMARPQGPTCHLQRPSCFPDAPADALGALDAVIADRAASPQAGSYTARLFESGIRRIALNVGDDGVESGLAGVVQDDEALLGEAADLVYHLLVLLRARGLGLDAVRRVLDERASPGR